MTEEQLLKMLADEKDEIAAAVRKKAVEAMTASLSWQLPQSVTKAVTEFFEAEIVPEIKAHLADQKGPIVDASIKAASEIGDLVAAQMVKQAVESMTGYRSSEVIKALMGVR